MTRLILASASPARLTTLRSAGVEPEVVVSGVDEDAVLADAAHAGMSLGPADVARVLARAKAEAAASRFTGRGTDTVPDGIVLVLGCDSVFELDGEAYGKPADADEARERWRVMRGRSGVLHTGHRLIDCRDGVVARSVDQTISTTVHFADVSDAEIEAYVSTGEPLHVAGAFTIDSLGGPLVEGVEGDHHNVVGISLPALRHMLAECGIPWHDLHT